MKKLASRYVNRSTCREQLREGGTEIDMRDKDGMDGIS